MACRMPNWADTDSLRSVGIDTGIQICQRRLIMTSVTVNASQSRLMHSINCWRRQGELITFIGFVANAWSLGRQVPFQWQAETE